MGLLSFYELCGETKLRLGNRADFDDLIYSTSSYTRGMTWVNYAYQDICTMEYIARMFAFPELETHVSTSMVASQTSYTLPSDCAVILGIRDHSNNQFLNKIDYRTIDRISQTTGKPLKYARWGNTLMLDPMPDSTYTMRLRYIKRPAWLATTDVTLLPALWDEGIIIKACEHGFDALQEHDRAAVMRTSFNSWLKNRVPDFIGDTANSDYNMQPDIQMLQGV